VNMFECVTDGCIANGSQVGFDDEPPRVICGGCFEDMQKVVSRKRRTVKKEAPRGTE
jgi:Zn finger protein HypA/HybF involved in hydrogenase expression